MGGSGGSNGGVDDGSVGNGGDGSRGGDDAELGRLEAGGWLGIGEVGSKDLRRIDRGIRFVAGVGGRPGGEGGGEGSVGQLTMGDDSTELGRSDTVATDVIGVVGSMHRGPLGRRSIGGGKGNAEGVRSTKGEGGDGAGEGSTGAAGALAARSVDSVDVSGTGGEGALAGSEGAGRTSDLWAANCGSGLCRMSRNCCFTSGGNWALMSG